VGRRRRLGFAATRVAQAGVGDAGALLSNQKFTIPIVRSMRCHEPRPGASGASLAAWLFFFLSFFIYLFSSSGKLQQPASSMHTT